MSKDQDVLSLNLILHYLFVPLHAHKLSHQLSVLVYIICNDSFLFVKLILFLFEQNTIFIIEVEYLFVQLNYLRLIFRQLLFDFVDSKLRDP